MTSVKGMTAPSPSRPPTHSILRTEFDTTAQAADGCITNVASIDRVGPQTVQSENTNLPTR